MNIENIEEATSNLHNITSDSSTNSTLSTLTSSQNHNNEDELSDGNSDEKAVNSTSLKRKNLVSKLVDNKRKLLEKCSSAAQRNKILHDEANYLNI